MAKRDTRPKKRAATEVRGPHGGARPGSGRKTRYPHKLPRTFSIWLTQAATAILKAAQRRNRGASMSDVFEKLLRDHGHAIDLPPLPKGKHSPE